MQFAGQTHVLTVAVPSADFERDDLLRAFERAYWERFEVALAEMRCLLVSLRTTIVGRRRAVSLEGLAGAPASGSLRDAQTAERLVSFDGGWLPTPIYRRERMPRGAELLGPAIVEQLDTTAVVEPGDRATVDALANLVITVRPL